ncbi:hypothetical protein EDE11_10143 [Methylomonas methanica]|uniref:Uncharacterized protein n=1 Tax=Methylomonas methanica TaxID=421 RepID=A0ABY2CSM3_METMH|nr:hypothetical protein EDE11_10143 [Methylomonas methanica]
MRRHSGFLGLAINPVPIRGRKKSSLSSRERVGVIDQCDPTVFSPSPYPLPEGEGIYAAGYRDFGISYLAPHMEAAWIP